MLIFGGITIAVLLGLLLLAMFSGAVVFAKILKWLLLIIVPAAIIGIWVIYR